MWHPGYSRIETHLLEGESEEESEVKISVPSQTPQIPGRSRIAQK